jgi:hypothetical protein
VRSAAIDVRRACSSSAGGAVGRGLLQLLIVGLPIAVGLYALHEPVNQSFGIALLCIGFVLRDLAIDLRPGRGASSARSGCRNSPAEPARRNVIRTG